MKSRPTKPARRPSSAQKIKARTLARLLLPSRQPVHPKAAMEATEQAHQAALAIEELMVKALELYSVAVAFAKADATKMAVEVAN